MEINDTSISVYLSCRWFGFAPYTITRNKLNQIIDFKLHRLSCVYGFVLMFIFCFSTEYALFYDMYSGHSLRAKSVTSRYVYWLDLNMLVAAFMINIVTSMRSVPNTRRVNDLLNRVDKHLNILDRNNGLHSMKMKRRISIGMRLAFFIVALMLIIDFGVWLRIASELQYYEQSHGIIGQNFNSTQYYLIPFYMMYSSFVPLHAKFASTLYRVGLRYRSLNKIICSNSSVGERLTFFSLDKRSLAEFTTRLFTIDETLGQVVHHVQSEFGLTVITLIASCLFHLVISIYFVFLEFLGHNDLIFAGLQCIWIAFHVTRLIIIIEPCHMITTESKRTLGCVSRMLRLRQDDFILKHLWQKLMAEEVVFAPCGIFRIDRQLITSISGAIATYLVILLQFQR